MEAIIKDGIVLNKAINILSFDLMLSYFLIDLESGKKQIQINVNSYDTTLKFTDIRDFSIDNISKEPDLIWEIVKFVTNGNDWLKDLIIQSKNEMSPINISFREIYNGLHQNIVQLLIIVKN